MQVNEKAISQPIAPTEPISEPLTTQTLAAPAEDDDNPDAIFLRAVSEIPTQPLNRCFTPQWELDRKLERECLFALVLFLVSLTAAVILNIVNQPVTTVTLLPVYKSTKLTIAIPIPTRTLSPVTITRTFTAPTTGKGHQEAKQAIGTLTFYNGLATSQNIQAGTMLTGNDGVKISTDESITIPAGNPPTYGEASVTAQALNPGGAGNIQALAINTTISSAVFVKNLTAFTGGRDARDFQAVAQRDLDSLTAKLQQPPSRG